jgi:hypothetical protein
MRIRLRRLLWSFPQQRSGSSGNRSYRTSRAETGIERNRLNRCRRQLRATFPGMTAA